MGYTGTRAEFQIMSQLFHLAPMSMLRSRLLTEWPWCVLLVNSESFAPSYKIHLPEAWLSSAKFSIKCFFRNCKVFYFCTCVESIVLVLVYTNALIESSPVAPLPVVSSWVAPAPVLCQPKTEPSSVEPFRSSATIWIYTGCCYRDCKVSNKSRSCEV